MAGEIPDWVQLSLGPVLALLPVLAWEVLIKPQRTRRNAALVLQAEIDISLGWLLRLVEARSARAGTLPATPRLPRDAYSANVGVLGELPTAILAKTMLFYSRLDIIVAAVEKLEHRTAELATREEDHRAEWLRDSVRRGQGSLDSSLANAVERGFALRRELFECARGTMFADAEALMPDARLVEQAKASEKARMAALGGTSDSHTS